MKHSTIYGAIAGAVGLIVAVPLLAQLANAQTSADTSSANSNQPVASQACVQAMAAKETAFLTNVDAFISSEKTARQAYRDALTAAASITDATARQAAIKKAREDLLTATKAAREAQRTTDKSAMDAVKTACGNEGFGGMMGTGPEGLGGGMMGRGGDEGFGGMMGRGRMMGGDRDTMLAKKLGITADELATELKSGKSIQTIAQEHGVTLPTPPQNRGMHRGWFMNGGQTSSQTSSQ